MLRQVRLESECFEAARAAKSFGAGVSLDVSSKVGTIGERLTAQSTRKGLLSRMRSFTRAQLSYLDFYHVLSCMKSFHLYDVSLRGLDFCRLLSRMRSLVSAQQPRPRERLVTRRATVLEIVGQKVHRQGGHRDVDLVAVGARSGVFAVDAAVRLLVTGQA